MWKKGIFFLFLVISLPLIVIDFGVPLVSSLVKIFYLGIPEPLLDILDLLLEVFFSLAIVIACKCELDMKPTQIFEKPFTEISTDLNTDVNLI